MKCQALHHSLKLDKRLQITRMSTSLNYFPCQFPLNVKITCYRIKTNRQNSYNKNPLSTKKVFIWLDFKCNIADSQCQ